MIQAQLKLRLNKKQEETLNEWLLILTRIWNWSIRKIELDKADGIYYSRMKFNNILAGHSTRLGVAGCAIQGMLTQAWMAWDRCFKKLGKKPRFKGNRNRLNSIHFPVPLKPPVGNHIAVPIIGKMRFHKMDLPEGRIKQGRIVKRASGWYLCLFIDAEPKAIDANGDRRIGIDPGYKTNLTTSDGEKIDTVSQFKAVEKRLAQAQRGKNKKLVARLQERIKNRRKDANHKLSHRLVAECHTIAFSKDNIKNLARKNGRQVAEASHYQLRQMLAYKSRAGGRVFVEVDSKFSTMTCSNCLATNGPTGKAGLSVRQWVCSDCGVHHDRDINAAVNTLIAGVKSTLEWCVKHRPKPNTI